MTTIRTVQPVLYARPPSRACTTTLKYIITLLYYTHNNIYTRALQPTMDIALDRRMCVRDSYPRNASSLFY